MALFIAFCSVIPIDSISQASQTSTNYALNTFVVVGALVLFFITASFLVTTRIYSERSGLQDIPRQYVPLEPGDLPKECLDMINKNYKNCEMIIKSINKETGKDVKHHGISSPNSKYLPPLIPFEDIITALVLKFKWDNDLFTGFVPPNNLSFREIIAVLESRKIASDKKLNREFIDLYERLRYSGKYITEEDCIEFMKLSIDFMKSSKTNINQEDSKLRKYTESELTRSTTDSESIFNK
ncbi:hypothetical protein WICMUC_002717 [Wickerhamomyces mucosus]|uniref:Defect at low temperature protein 1 n=1 Tax=Wickerhamomyces mucosus TaxID=1378264 RepID=A0A9P8PNK6_9ASCO|nr:hypothetical protein WICMUC_002717 [Wickerhamomyces mucosus]